MISAKVIFVLTVAIILIKPSIQTLQEDIAAQLQNTSEKSLERHRRYLVFPEGSSLQLVFCLTIPSLGVGSIFTVGNTVSLAWELPHDPFVPFRRPSEILHRADEPKKPETKLSTWKTQNVKIAAPVMKTHYNPFFINKPISFSYSTMNGYPSNIKSSPFYTSVDNSRLMSSSQGNGARKSYSSENYNGPITTYIHPVYHQVYRRTRRGLYNKIEKLFTALSTDGRACLLKAICEVSKATRERGTFMEEIIKAIFRVRHLEDNTEEERDEFDLAANKQHNCTDIYPTCPHSIWSGFFS